MSNIEKAINLIEQETSNKKSCSVFTAENSVDETTLCGTRDAYLNIVVKLLELVNEFDQSNKDEHWSDSIKENMIQLPSSGETWVVGTQVYKHHEQLIEQLKRDYQGEPDILSAIESDPDF